MTDFTNTLNEIYQLLYLKIKKQNCELSFQHCKYSEEISTSCTILPEPFDDIDMENFKINEFEKLLKKNSKHLKEDCELFFRIIDFSLYDDKIFIKYEIDGDGQIISFKLLVESQNFYK